MGGEGHMLDMIKRMELNRQQKNYAGLKSSKKNKPALSNDFIKNIENIDVEKPVELSKEEKRKYRVLSIISLIIIVAALSFLLFKMLSK